MEARERLDPSSIEVFVGVDMAKGDHFAQALSVAGDELFNRPVANDEESIRALIAAATEHGEVALVVDQPASGAQLVLALARELGPNPKPSNAGNAAHRVGLDGDPFKGHRAS